VLPADLISPNAIGHPKAPSPLRSVGALHINLYISALFLENRAIFPIDIAYRRQIWTAVAKRSGDTAFFKRIQITERHRLSKNFGAYNDFKNAIKAARSVADMLRKTSRDAAASPSCQRIASSSVRARPSCR